MQKHIKPPHNQTNWGYIFIRDRLWILGTIALMLIAAIIVITLMPREYVATAFITAPQNQTAINWDIEQQILLSDRILNDVQNQLFPVQSTKNFAGFRPLKLPKTLEKTPINRGINTIIDKLNIAKAMNAERKAIGLYIRARSINQAEAMMITRLITDAYLRANHDETAKQTAQQNGLIRSEVLKKRKILIDAETILAQYKTKHAALLADAKTKDELKAGDIEKTRAAIAEMATRYGPKHPVMIELNTRLHSLETPVNSEDSAQSARTNLITQTALQLTHDVDLARADLNQFLQKNGAGLSANPAATTRTIAGAITLNPDYNFDRSMIMWGLILGALLGLSLVAIKQKIRPRLQTLSDLPAAVKTLPTLGTITKTAIESDKIKQFKTMRHELRLRFSDPKLLVITSDCDDRLMPETALNFARTIAKTGEKIMIIDTNWVRPTLQHFAPNPKNRTLIDYLAGGASLEDILNRDDPSGVHILYGGEVPMTGIDLLSGTKFSNLLLSFRQIYDLVILVAPPVAQGADTRVLSKLSDAALFTIIKDKSSLNGVKIAYGLLAESHIKSIATLWID